MKSKVYLVAVIALMVMMSACAKMPTPEIDMAKAATQEAVDEGASVYQAEQLAAVQDSLNMVMEQIEVQKSKLIPRYGEIKTKLGQVKTMAESVKQSTGVRKNEIRQQAQTMMSETAALIETNKSLTASAPKGKEGVAALEMINADIVSIESQLEEARVMLSNEELIKALDKTMVAREKAESIQTELKTVIEKSAKKNRK
jgi:hypothetical protein